MTPIRMNVLSSGHGALGTRCWLFRSSLHLHLLHELSDADHGASHGPASNLLRVVAGRDAQRIETSIEGFEHGLGLYACADSAGSAMLNANGRSHRDLVAFAVRLQRMKCRRLHQPDHVRRG